MKAIQWVLIFACLLWLTILTVVVIDTAESITTILKVVAELHK